MKIDTTTDRIIQFANNLLKYKYASWIDKFGKYEVIMGEKIIEKELKTFRNINIILSDYLQNKPIFQNLLRKKDENNSPHKISIGSFETHNSVKIQNNNNEYYLVTIPIPLTNDSFGTNRCSYNNLPSFNCCFPDMTIFDLFFLTLFGQDFNVFGLGEFVGLYYSIIDYCLSRNLKLNEKLIGFISNIYNKLCFYFHYNKLLFIEYLSVALTIKCLIMRVNEDHQIGCCIDHLISGYIEKKSNIYHGKAVYLGSILSSALFPEWERFGISMYTIIKNGINIGIITNGDLINLCEMQNIIEESIRIRPNRNSLLKLITQSNLKVAKKKIINVTNSI